jgi:hypothetical protein
MADLTTFMCQFKYSEIFGANHRFISTVSTNQFINGVSEIGESSDEREQLNGLLSQLMISLQISLVMKD